MKFSVINLGCRSNYFDGELLAQKLTEKGYTRVQEQADIYIINTCTVTSEADRSSRQFIYRAKRENPKAIVVATGCYAQTNPQALARLKEVDLVVGNSHKDRLVEILEDYLQGRGERVFVDNIFKDSQVKNFDLVVFFERVRPFIKVQEGCNNFCTFCVIPYARGKLRSVPMEKVLEQVKSLAERGFKEIVLTGTQLTQYGWDLNTNLYQLLLELLRIKDIELFRLSSLYPSEIDQKLLDLITQEERIAPHFHLSLQSGSNRILRLMERDYTVEDYIKLVETIVQRRPISAIGTDIIVGFPTETEEDFEETYKLVQNLPFAYLHVFSYSDRPHTKASKMFPKVEERFKKERVRLLKALDQKKREDFKGSMKGKTLRAIILEEGRALTENYIHLEDENFKDVGAIVSVVL
ncbi:tRNA (N(6)-L-threonylcarbamoyladenosine(37)-C(2))-methylthiotransferase MtaB [Thermocrinis sp.]|jgi:threonylcarbamoyladenosine tRNA methylthiotransferase MtaB|uniref:tRNA (N(6)-L-threonylcarbamoyladenosine(37)-C(2))- methylthiotransferase MtaB n=1 Tax=Thermocrinis sp. TaxID=2024383 RepID=UPI003C0550AC